MPRANNFLLIMAALAVGCGIMGCEAQSMSNINLSKIEDAWTRGMYRDYYIQAARTATEIATNQPLTSLEPVATRLLRSLVSKTTRPSDAGTEDIAAMAKL